MSQWTKLVPVSNPSAAEMVKLLEKHPSRADQHRVGERDGHHLWQVGPLTFARASLVRPATKPYGFMPFYPGPGLGGHPALPIDSPCISPGRLRALHYSTRFIELADNINSNMPRHVVEKIISAPQLPSKADQWLSLVGAWGGVQA